MLFTWESSLFALFIISWQLCSLYPLLVGYLVTDEVISSILTTGITNWISTMTEVITPVPGKWQSFTLEPVQFFFLFLLPTLKRDDSPMLIVFRVKTQIKKVDKEKNTCMTSDTGSLWVPQFIMYKYVQQPHMATI